MPLFALVSGSRGFKILHKMGWRKGQGLGRHENGIKEPVNILCVPLLLLPCYLVLNIILISLKVRLNSSYGLLGIGKAAEYDMQSTEATKQRKRLEVEVQLAETDDERKAREEKVARKEETRAQVIYTYICSV